MKKITLILIILLSCISNAQNTKPQEPVPPFNYTIENVFFENTSDQVKLAGTITIPKDKKDFKTVILISGSGPQNRDSELLGHKPFLVIADYLSSRGIAVLRVDDRGTAESEGEYNETSLEGFVRDTESAMAYLKTRQDINPAKIGLIGHSLGGVIAPIVASRSEDVAFVVMLAGSGIRGDKLMLLQKANIERKMGVNETAVQMGQKNFTGAYDLILDKEIAEDSLKPRLKTYFKTAFMGMLPENQLEAITQQLTLPWLKDFLRFDPAVSLSQVSCPVLALNGTKDTQVPAQENLKAIDSILRVNENKSVIVKEFEDLNHLFQECETGLPTEYANIEQTFSPKVLEFMHNWIISQP